MIKVSEPQLNELCNMPVTAPYTLHLTHIVYGIQAAEGGGGRCHQICAWPGHAYEISD